MKQKHKKVTWRYIVALFVLFGQIGIGSMAGAIGSAEYSWQDVGIDTQSSYWAGLDGSNDSMKLIAIGRNDLYRSEDGGASWSIMPGMASGISWRSVASSSDGSILVAAENGSNKPLRISTDSGTTWSTRTLPYASAYFDDLMLSDSGGYLYAYDYSNLYVSTDLGQTWSTRTAFDGTCSIPYVSSDSSGMKLLLACFYGASPGALRASNDGGGDMD